MAKAAKAPNTCGDCIWLNRDFNGDSCNDVGFKRADKACSNFEPEDPHGWLGDLASVATAAGALPELEDSANTEMAVAECREWLKKLKLPKAFSGESSSKMIQEIVGTTSAQRSRIVAITVDLAVTRRKLHRLYQDVEREISGFDEYKKAKTQAAKDLLLAIAGAAVGNRLDEIDSILGSCRDLTKGCDSVLDAVKTMTSAHYAVRERAL